MSYLLHVGLSNKYYQLYDVYLASKFIQHLKFTQSISSCVLYHSLKPQSVDILPATKPRPGCVVVNGSLFCPAARKLSITLPYFPSLFTPAAINNSVVRRPLKCIHFILSVVSNFLFIVPHYSCWFSQGSTFLRWICWSF